MLSIDGIGAFNQISRDGPSECGRSRAGVAIRVDVLRRPFSLLVGRRSFTLSDRGEGGEQGDALMPLFFALGQHSALEAIQEELHEGEQHSMMTPQVLPNESVRCTYSSSRNICTVIPAFGSMAGKRKCGIRQESDQVHAMFWSVSHGRQILTRVGRTRFA